MYVFVHQISADEKSRRVFRFDEHVGHEPFPKTESSSRQHLRGSVLDPEISVLGIFPVGILKMWVNTHIHTHTCIGTHALLVTIEKKKGGRKPPKHLSLGEYKFQLCIGVLE